MVLMKLMDTLVRLFPSFHEYHFWKNQFIYFFQNQENIFISKNMVIILFKVGHIVKEVQSYSLVLSFPTLTSLKKNRMG